jgi:hypothetical protein
VAITECLYRLVYRKRPCGEHKYRLQSLRPAQGAQGRVLVTCSEVQQRVKGVDELKPGFGVLPRRTAFTKTAREIVRDGAACLEARFGQNVVFGTGTLAGSTESSFRALAEWSGYVAARLRQWIRHHCPTAQVVWVWELQKRGALHMHAAIGSDSEAERRFLMQHWHRQWCHLLTVVSEKTGVDLFERFGGGTWKNDLQFVRANCEPVWKSVSRYLSKYLSKSVSKNEDGTQHCPSRWWGCDQAIRDAILDGTTIRASRAYVYEIANEMFESICGEFAAAAESVFAWKQKFFPLNRTCVFYFPAPPPQPQPV